MERNGTPGAKVAIDLQCLQRMPGAAASVRAQSAHRPGSTDSGPLLTLPHRHLYRRDLRADSASGVAPCAIYQPY